MSKVNQPVDCAQWKDMECDGRKVVREMWRDCAQSNDSLIMMRDLKCAKLVRRK